MARLQPHLLTSANFSEYQSEWMNEVFIKNSQTAVVTIVRW